MRVLAVLLIASLLAACSGAPAATTPTGAPGIATAATAGAASATPDGTPGAATTASPTPDVATAAPSLPPPTPTDDGPFELVAPNPLHVTPVLDASQAVTGVIPAEGGSLSAVAADGSVFTLTVPAGALLSDQPIVMTPMLDVGGQALSGGFAAGVDLAPDGLQLLAAATLTIVPAQPVPIESELSFAIHGPDREALLFPLVPTVQAATFVLTHFSGYYLAAGDEADQAAQMARTPTEAADQLLQQLQGIISGERLANLLGQPGAPEFEAQVGPLLKSYLKKVLLPRIAQAKTSDDWRFVCQVMAEVTGFQRTVELLGLTDLDPPFDHETILNDLLARQAVLLIGHATALCDDGQRLTAWLHILRVARTQMVRKANYGVSVALWEERCPPPTLSFMARMTRTMYWPYAGNASRLLTDVQVEAEAPLRFNVGLWAFTGSGPLTLTVLGGNSIQGVSGHDGNRYCAMGWSPVGSTLTVEALKVNLNQMACSDSHPPHEDAGFELMVNPGLPNEHWAQDCSVVDTSIPLNNNDSMGFHGPWIDVFRFIHRELIADDSLQYNDNQGWVFTGPSKLKLDQWRFGPDGASAYAVLRPYEPTRACPECLWVDVVEDYNIEVR